MAEPIEQAPAWVRALMPSPEELAAADAEALVEIAKWKRGEPSRVMTFEELFAWLDALDAADEDADAGPDTAHPGPAGCQGS
jgi:hypothetical protein